MSKGDPAIIEAKSKIAEAISLLQKADKKLSKRKFSWSWEDDLISAKIIIEEIPELFVIWNPTYPV